MRVVKQIVLLLSRNLHVAFVVGNLFSALTLAQTSPLCNDLARLSCAPGSYKDGTGEIKSESEVARSLRSYSDKSKAYLDDKITKLLENPNEAYFKEVAMAALGLKNSPQCTSNTKDDKAVCRENLVEGLTLVAQKQALARLAPRTGLERRGNLKGLSYITENNSYRKILQEFSDKAQKDLSDPELLQKIKEKIFPKVKDLIIARINAITITEEQKRFMINKIKSISFEGSNCKDLGGYGSTNSESISSLLVPNAFYDPMKNIFKICSGYLLQSTSEFQIVADMAHELGHSVDPCYIARGPEDLAFKYSNPNNLAKSETEFPFKNVIQCLRDQRSVAAQNFAKPKKNRLSEAAASDSESKANFCEKDQIGESFADWMSAEVLPVYMEQNYKLNTDQYKIGYANANRLMCSDEEKVPGYDQDEEVHPLAAKRINKIFLVNPKIRSQMGCGGLNAESIYCESEKPQTKLGPGEPASSQPSKSESVRQNQ